MGNCIRMSSSSLSLGTAAAKMSQNTTSLALRRAQWNPSCCISMAILLLLAKVLD